MSSIRRIGIIIGSAPTMSMRTRRGSGREPARSGRQHRGARPPVGGVVAGGDGDDRRWAGVGVDDPGSAGVVAVGPEFPGSGMAGGGRMTDPEVQRIADTEADGRGIMGGRLVACPSCSGSGEVAPHRGFTTRTQPLRCQRCGGSGTITSDGKEEAGSRFDAQSLAGGRRGEPASGELLPIAQPPEHDTSEVSAVEGQTAQYDGDANG